jgi:hypothetical protein
MKGIKFPVINARLLTGKPLKLPEDARGRVSLILVAFVRQEPGLVEAWVEPFRQAQNPAGLAFYRIALLGDSAIPNIVDLGMKMGVPASKHGWTATAYGQRERLRQELGIADQDSLHLYLLDGEGTVRWTGRGAPDQEALQELLKIARETAGPGSDSGPKKA